MQKRMPGLQPATGSLHGLSQKANTSCNHGSLAPGGRKSDLLWKAVRGDRANKILRVAA